MSARTLACVVCLVAGLVVTGARASLVERAGLEALAGQADRVAVVQLVSSSSAWDEAGRRIWTSLEFRVEEDLAGQGPATFRIEQPGGVVGRFAQVTHGYPTFVPHESVLLFLRRSSPAEDGGWRVVGLSQGVFALEAGPRGLQLRQRLEGLSFPDQPARPLVFPWAEALQRIRAAFASREVRP
jgi:hypothetical protein